jgi:hypothetical protein
MNRKAVVMSIETPDGGARIPQTPEEARAFLVESAARDWEAGSADVEWYKMAEAIADDPEALRVYLDTMAGAAEKARAVRTN